MRALSIEWLERFGERARVLGVIIAADGSVSFHVKIWAKRKHSGGNQRNFREEVWSFDRMTEYVDDSSRTARAAQKAGIE